METLPPPRTHSCTPPTGATGRTPKGNGDSKPQARASASRFTGSHGQNAERQWRQFLRGKRRPHRQMSGATGRTPKGNGDHVHEYRSFSPTDSGEPRAERRKAMETTPDRPAHSRRPYDGSHGQNAERQWRRQVNDVGVFILEVGSHGQNAERQWRLGTHRHPPAALPRGATGRTPKGNGDLTLGFGVVLHLFSGSHGQNAERQWRPQSRVIRITPCASGEPRAERRKAMETP